ncbi:MAG TPA: sigma-70 family RNA polymerase sigma factor [Jatrophihabitantaceae bacterium]|jgi:RNA polymerase sigma-70 factor (ECF subfamily)
MGRYEVTTADDTDLLDALRRGEEQAFRELMGRHQPMLLRLARIYAPSRAVAEEIVQETWLAVLRGLAGFEGRAALHTWMARILVNIARRRSGREARSMPLSALARAESGGVEASVDPDRFLTGGPYAGHWASFPDDWSGVPENVLLSQEVHAVACAAIARLPPAQRMVITLRDLQGWSPPEVCAVLEISEANHRVLLHRARARVRQTLEDYLRQV